MGSADMMIHDKQALRRCLKQLVRHADVVETALDFDVVRGEMGVAAMLGSWTGSSYAPGESLRRAGGTTPLCADAAAMFAALDALELPVHDLDRADTMQKTYDRDAYPREILDVMHAKRVLVRTPMARAEDARFEDDRFAPLLEIGEALFAPGRYGVDYAACAQRIIEAAACCGAKHVSLPAYDEAALTYCLLPACQDAGLTLHVLLANEAQIARFAQLLDGFAPVRALACAPAAAEGALIDAAVHRERLTVRLSSLDHLPLALGKLGVRFVPYASCASLPEQMLGRWVNAREAIWQALANAYLPLARSGVDLTTEALERDVAALLCGAFDA